MSRRVGSTTEIPWPVAAAAADHLAELHDIAAQQADAGIALPCAGAPEMFFPLPADDIAMQVRLCTSCPALRPCGTFADLNGERHGIWGGRRRDTTERTP